MFRFLRTIFCSNPAYDSKGRFKFLLGRPSNPAACGVEGRCERKCECPRCGGAGSFVEGGALNPRVAKCERCDGTGLIECVETPGMP